VVNQMNDPVTNVEIEDVLSSIRRLVSENARTARPADVGKDATDDEDKLVEAVAEIAQQTPSQDQQMLVLTPALRVGEVAEDEADSDGPTDDAEPAEDVQPDADVAADAATIEVAIQDAVQEAVETVTDEVLGDRDLADDAGDAPAFEDQDPGTGDMIDSFAFSHSDDLPQSAEMSTLEDRIAGLEAAVAQREDDWEPDGIGDDDNAGAPVEALRWEDSDAAKAGWEAAADRPDEDAQPVIDLSAYAEAEPEVVAPAEIDLPEEAPEPEAEAGEHLEPAAAADQANSKSDADPELAQGLALDPRVFGAEDSVIDEEMLREMVAEIVRQELQGPLGERITRNVRKLVRREIHRALAARELD